jgi:hypothetical protein
VIGSTTSDGGGIYSLEIPAGSDYRLEFTRTGYLVAILHGLSVAADVEHFVETIATISVAYTGNGNVSGTITNALTGAGVAGLTVSLREGINNLSGAPVATAITDMAALYNFIGLPAGYFTAEVSGQGYNASYFTVICLGGTTRAFQNANVTPELPPGQIRIVLNWSVNPEDLDAHLTGPIATGGRFHVFYDDGQYPSVGTPLARLDWDDVQSFGPETITVHQQTAGVYRYSVHDFTNSLSANSAALSNSGAQVRVYRGDGLLATFNVPTNRVGTLWTVFELNGDVLTPINTMSNQANEANVLSVSALAYPATDAELMQNLPVK